MKKILLLTLFILLLSSAVVSAHTALEESSPVDGETVAEEPREIVLEFNTSLEEASSFTVENAEGEEIPFGVTIEDQKMIGTLGAAMADGEYTVNWKIIGADGHPIEGTYAFTVKTEEETVPAEENEETADPVSEDPEQETAPLLEEQQTDQEESSNAPYVMVIVLMVLAVIAVGTLMWAAKRREN
ncbi:copper resistance CopC family protein [Planococcus sp. 107-1]|uniref:copper resistance CopC family protein n=1 Tax=Planococcus sp. 107-1 TaxID=2908840 RepID=UPI001F194B8F|nr:copper resistance CopC family protein [Planococcus sp. 107-1]UJF25506.1 copper resistance protein CopC [Planococcus sp. 107-1]